MMSGPLGDKGFGVTVGSKDASQDRPVTELIQWGKPDKIFTLKPQITSGECDLLFLSSLLWIRVPPDRSLALNCRHYVWLPPVWRWPLQSEINLKGYFSSGQFVYAMIQDSRGQFSSSTASRLLSEAAERKDWLGCVAAFVFKCLRPIFSFW